MNDIAYIIMTEHWDEDSCTSYTYNRVVFLNEGDAIKFLNEHNPREFSQYDDDKPKFFVDMIRIGSDFWYDPSDDLQAAIEAANRRF